MGHLRTLRTFLPRWLAHLLALRFTQKIRKNKFGECKFSYTPSNTQKSRSRDSIDRIGIQIDFTEFYDRTSVYISNRCQTSFSCNCCLVSGQPDNRLSFNFFDTPNSRNRTMRPQNVIFITIFTRTIDQVQICYTSHKGAENRSCVILIISSQQEEI